MSGTNIDKFRLEWHRSLVRGALGVAAALAVLVVYGIGPAAAGTPAAPAAASPDTASASVAGWTAPVTIWPGTYRDPSMVVDRHGSLHVVARGETGIWYLTNASGRWTRARLTLDIEGKDGGGTEGIRPRIALDPSDGSLTVVYVRETFSCCETGSWFPTDLRYVTNRSGHWSAPATIPGSKGTDGASIVVRNRVIAVAASYRYWDQTTVRFLTNASGHWTGASLGALAVGGPSHPSLALDSNRHPWIAFGTGVAWPANNRIRLATGATRTGGFATATIASGARFVDPVLALTAGNQPRLAWSIDNQTSVGKVHYAYRNASGWHRVTIPADAPASQLVLDGRGGPHLVGGSGGGLWYASKVGDAWKAVTLDTHDLYAASLALSRDGRISVVYERGDHVWFVQSR